MSANIRYTGITSKIRTPSEDVEIATTPINHPIEMSQSRCCDCISKKKQDVLITASLSFVFLTAAILLYQCSSSKKETYRDSTLKSPSFERDHLSPLAGSYGDKNAKSLLGVSPYPAILLYQLKSSDDLYGHIPKEWVDSGEPILLVDQITKGVGVKELWWDPGSVISQDLVHFNTAGLSKLVLIAPQGEFRGLSHSSYKKSFADAIYWSTDIVDKDEYGYIVRLTDLLFLPAGVGHSDNLSGRIKKVYDVKYVLDLSRSFVHLPGCHCGQSGSSVEMNFTYALQDFEMMTDSIPLDSVLTVSLKRTFLKLEKIPDYEMRKYHPKSGFNSISYKNESESLIRPVDLHFLTRHHLINMTDREIKDRKEDSQNEISIRNAIYDENSQFKARMNVNHDKKVPISSKINFNSHQNIRRGSDLVSEATSSSTFSLSQSYGYYLSFFGADTHANVPLVLDGCDLLLTSNSDQPASSSPIYTFPIDSLSSNPLPPSTTSLSSSSSRPPLSSSPLQLLYLIDNTTPSPIREALVDGISWWDEAFQYAGYPPGTFQARVAPDDFDPYNLTRRGVHFVEWIDRDRRSFSVGIRVFDPRTGQILTGHARIGEESEADSTLYISKDGLLSSYDIIIDGEEINKNNQSLRMRQDALIAEALLGPFSLPNGSIDTVLESQIMATLMARCRSLGAHEVGHTLGLAHNFAGSSFSSGPASVMDYPAPVIMIDGNGDLALSKDAYAQRIGFFDKVAINYGYRIFTESGEDLLLQRLVDDAEAEGYVFLTDQDSAASEADWRDTEWDSGLDPVSALKTALIVRAKALSKLSSRSVPGGVPLDSLQEILPPIFLWHRYEVVATAKLLGGASFQYTLRGDRTERRQGLKSVAADMQRKALNQLLVCLTPSLLAVPDSLLPFILPEAFGFQPAIGGSPDVFGSRVGALFDRLAATESAVNIVVSAVFSPERAERLATQQYQNRTLPSFIEVLQSFTKEVILSQYQCYNLTSTRLQAQSLTSLQRFKTMDGMKNIDHLSVENENYGATFTMVHNVNISIRNIRRAVDSNNNDNSDNDNNSNHNDYRLESMVAQSVLVNSYLIILNDPRSSGLVVGQIKNHLRFLIAEILQISKKLKIFELNQDVQKLSSDDASNLDLIAHLELLSDAIIASKPFLRLLPLPLGPPI